MEFKKDKLYKIRFFDHCTGLDHPMTCEVCGWVIKSDPEYVCLSYWQVITNDTELKENNRELVTILKSAIISKRKID